ncbi:MAG: hypothetical protein GXW99_07410 [Clostridiales bacterium]|nr:hypothetical protein [Clostridiales bacterium]
MDISGMSSLSIFFFNAVIALFAFFGVAPLLMSAVSVFGIQRRFATMMIAEGVIKEEDVKMIQPKKMIAAVVIALIVLGALALVCIQFRPYGYLSGIIPLVIGLLKYQKVCEFNSLTVKRFRNDYKLYMNTEKYNKYVEKNF